MTTETKIRRSVYGKKTGHIATRGALSAEGKTVTEAKAALDMQIDWACGPASASQIESRFGLILIMHGTPNGYVWRVIDPSEFAHGKEFYAACSVGQVSYSETLSEMRSAAAQRAWSVFVPDDEARA